MNIRRILISEQDKKSILGLYGVDKTLVNEQESKLNPDGTYTVRNDQRFKSTGALQTIYKGLVIIKKGTIITPIGNGILTFDLYYEDKGINDTIDQVKKFKNDLPSSMVLKGEIKKLDKTGFYRCGYKKIGIGDMNTQWYNEYNSDVFLKIIDSLFCNGKVLKKEVDSQRQTPEQLKQTDQQKPSGSNKCESVKIIPTNEQLCYLDGDSRYVYAKKDGEYYTSRQSDKKRWCKLTASKWPS